MAIVSLNIKHISNQLPFSTWTVLKQWRNWPAVLSGDGVAVTRPPSELVLPFDFLEAILAAKYSCRLRVLVTCRVSERKGSGRLAWLSS